MKDDESDGGRSHLVPTFQFLAWALALVGIIAGAVMAYVPSTRQVFEQGRAVNLPFDDVPTILRGIGTMIMSLALGITADKMLSTWSKSQV